MERGGGRTPGTEAIDLATVAMVDTGLRAPAAMAHPPNSAARRPREQVTSSSRPRRSMDASRWTSDAPVSRYATAWSPDNNAMPWMRVLPPPLGSVIETKPPSW